MAQKPSLEARDVPRLGQILLSASCFHEVIRYTISLRAGVGDAVLRAPCAEISLLVSDQNRRCQACCRTEPWLPAECVSDLEACRVASPVPSLMKPPRTHLKGEPSSSEMTLYGKLRPGPLSFLMKTMRFSHTEGRDHRPHCTSPCGCGMFLLALERVPSA